MLKRRSHWQSLPESVWVKILSLLSGQNPDGRGEDESWPEALTLDSQYELLKISLVCKELKAVAQAPQLSSHLIVPEEIPLMAVPSLMQRLLKTRYMIAHLKARCQSPILEAVLAACMQPKMQLRTAVLGTASDHAMQMLPLYSGLTALDFTATEEENVVESRLYLTPLQLLPHLASLHVEAEDCDGLHHLQHLTDLHVISAREHTRERCHFVSSLCNLYLDDSSVYLDSLGIAALSQLTSLSCHDSVVLADLDEHRFCDKANKTDMPADRTPQCLVQLCITISGGVNAESGLAWIASLASLTSLELQFVGLSTIADSPTNLQRLSSLSLQALTSYSQSVTLYIHWRKVRSLQHLKLQDISST